MGIGTGWDQISFIIESRVLGGVISWVGNALLGYQPEGRLQLWVSEHLLSRGKLLPSDNVSDGSGGCCPGGRVVETQLLGLKLSQQGDLFNKNTERAELTNGPLGNSEGALVPVSVGRERSFKMLTGFEL